jgi:hypothetical protein
MVRLQVGRQGDDGQTMHPLHRSPAAPGLGKAAARRPGGRRVRDNAAAMTWTEAFELASYVVTVVGLPFAIGIFFYEQRKERENEEEEQYQHLSDAYNEFLRIVLDHADLQLRTHEPLPDPTPEQRERMLVIFDMLISLFERAYLVAYKDEMDRTERRRWNSWDDYMREWCRRDDFFNALPLLLRGEDPDFQSYIKRVADEERGGSPILSASI